MGGAGGSFGQSFADTLIRGMSLQSELANRQEALKIQRDIADANLKLHAAQTADLERKARAASKLAAKMIPQQIGGGLEGPQATVPGQASPQDLMAFAAETGDVGHMMQLMAPKTFKPGEGLSEFYPFTGETRQIAAPQAPPLNPIAERALQQIGGAGQPAAPGQEAPQGGGEPGAPQPQQPSPLNPGGIRYEPPKISVDPKGGVTVSSGPVKMNVHVEKIEYPAGSGQFQSVAVAIDPTNPSNRQMIPLGKPVPSEQMQKFGAIAESWGIPAGPARDWAVGAIADVTTTYTGPAQAIAMEDLKAKLQAAVGKGLGGTATKAGSVLERAQDLEAKGAGKSTAARIQAQNENEPPQGAAQNKIQMLESVERQMGLVEKNFNEKFVGKGLGNFSDKLKAEYAKQEDLARKGQYSGALAGNVRAFLGTASPEEVTFRNALLDSADLLLRARSGAQINESEYARLKSILPNLTDEPNTFLPAMKRFQDETKAIINDTLRIGSTSAKEQIRQREGSGRPKSTPPPGFK